MLNHIPIICKMYGNECKETFQTSFMKFTAHQFLLKVTVENSMCYRNDGVRFFSLNVSG